MKIYIATPVNGRKEATLEEKRRAAFYRVKELEYEISKSICGAEFCEFHSAFDNDIAPLDIMLSKRMFGCDTPPEPVIMGKCVQRVMECDAIYLDEGWMRSNGCIVEYTTANCYGKELIKGLSAKEEWKPAQSIDEAAAIVRANPITKDMTYEERLAAQKKRFGL